MATTVPISATAEKPISREAYQAGNQDKPNLDIMRAFAVVAVVFAHTCQCFGKLEIGRLSVVSFGIFGVLLFFVHTTLVLMWSLERRPHTLDFYIRRIFRIYPLAIVTIVVVLAFHMPLAGVPGDPIRWVPHSFFNVVSNVLLIQNLTHQYPVEAVMWSLPLEMQMYVVLPAVFIFARKERALWPILILWGLAAAISRSLFGNAVDGNIVSVVPCFLPGVIAYVGFANRRPRLSAWMLAPLIACLALAFMWRPSIPMGWICCLALGLALPSFTQTRNRAIFRVGHTIAKYSYSIYLLHLVSLALAFHYLPIHSAALKVAVVVVSLAMLAPLAYHFVEEPMIEAGRRVAARIQHRSTELALR